MNRTKCDILILTATFGSGHKSVANAIKEYVQGEDDNLRVDIADIFEIVSPKIYKGIYKWYEFFVKNNSKLYNYFYYKKDNNKKWQGEELMMLLYKSDFTSFVTSKQPKVIISTFPLCSGLVSKYKERYKDNVSLITCITDVVDNWEWIYPNTDKYFVATSDIKDKLVRKGIEEEKIVATGIPVKKDFLEESPNKSTNGQDEGNKDSTILMMGGGVGLLPDDIEIYRWLNKLENVRTIVVTGNNKKLLTKLRECEDLTNVKVYGYTDRVHEFMKSADIIISKAGGVTLFEAINSKLPILVYKPTLGQEIENGKFIANKNIGSVIHDLDSLKTRIYQFLENDNYRKSLEDNLDKVKNKFNVDDLTRHILELYSSYNSDNYYRGNTILTS